MGFIGEKNVGRCWDVIHVMNFRCPVSAACTCSHLLHIEILEYWVLVDLIQHMDLLILLLIQGLRTMTENLMVFARPVKLSPSIFVPQKWYVIECSALHSILA